MEKFRSKAKDRIEIEVNDEGETIVLTLSDQTVLPKLAALAKELQGKAKAYKPSGGTEYENAISAMEFNTELCETMKSRVDDIFGAETCRKVFGDILPGAECFAEFFDAIRPYYEQYSKKRLAKYNPNRTGDFR